ncbi:MAG: nucleotidyltransferase domain-containing protein [Palaeococcus sp.]|uniref:nucleotidyltransferase domain-containing protein n=1 Tax=Palaeococcus sp. (in: euryarchaeotes) TaxID=2820298 RepID=UPI0025E74E07|nr:nucleotidyltransferase domain-containing protein [Palaeococcus sp. (in: euryarchaeotes)]MCD6559663.1 nucleotidyltransferase domain-containing protein [Palaeococcus sp. (in: euryarchaeotes)]
MPGDCIKKFEGIMKIAREFKEKYPEVFDIVVYGSTVRGKEHPRDLDIVIIYFGIKRGDERYYSIPFQFRKRLMELGYQREKLDIKGIDISELFEPNFFASLGILIEGYSLLKCRFLHELLNGEGHAMFTYKLPNEWDHNTLNKFLHALKGRDRRSGIIEELEGRYMSRGVVLIPVWNTEKFKRFLELWGVDYEYSLILKTSRLM